jgi:hypothetical protein
MCLICQVLSMFYYFVNITSLFFCSFWSLLIMVFYYFVILVFCFYSFFLYCFFWCFLDLFLLVLFTFLLFSYSCLSRSFSTFCCNQGSIQSLPDNTNIFPSSFHHFPLRITNTHTHTHTQPTFSHTSVSICGREWVFLWAVLYASTPTQHINHRSF